MLEVSNADIFFGEGGVGQEATAIFKDKRHHTHACARVCVHMCLCPELEVAPGGFVSEELKHIP